MSCRVAAQKAVNASVPRSNSWQPLRQRAEFLHLQSSGQKWVTPCFVVQALRDESSNPPHFGLTVTKKIGNAVVRNRIRRRLRAVIDAYADLPSLAGWRFVLIARKDAETKEFDQLCRDLAWAVKRLGSGEAR